MIVLFSSIFSPGPYWGGWYGRRFHRSFVDPRFFMGPTRWPVRYRRYIHRSPMGFGGHRR